MSGSLREQLEDIYQTHGELTPELVVETARDPAHPLHSRFDWDDHSAAEAYRRDQAKRLIRTVRVTYKDADDSSGSRSVRAFHAIRNEHRYVYEPAETVAVDPFKRRLLLQDMEREWQALKRRFAHFAEFADMIRRDLEEDVA